MRCSLIFGYLRRYLVHWLDLYEMRGLLRVPNRLQSRHRSKACGLSSQYTLAQSKAKSTVIDGRLFFLRSQAAFRADDQADCSRGLVFSPRRK